MQAQRTSHRQEGVNGKINSGFASNLTIRGATKACWVHAALWQSRCPGGELDAIRKEEEVLTTMVVVTMIRLEELWAHNLLNSEIL